MTAPLVSVILPTHNRAPLLRRALDSVLAQSFRDFELIVIDDASSDDTAAVLARYSDPRLRVLRSETNLFSAGARNLGIAQARGEWLAFQDSDDEWLLHKLAVQTGYAQTLPQDYALVGSRLLRHSPQGTESLEWPRLAASESDRGEVDRHAFVRARSAYLQSLLIRRSAFEAVGGFDESLRKSSDLELCLHLAQRYRFATLDEVTALSFETAHSLSQASPAAAVSWRAIIERHAAFLAEDPRILSGYLTELGRCELALGRRAAAAAALMRALRAQPRNLRAAFWLALLTLGRAALAARARLRQTSG